MASSYETVSIGEIMTSNVITVKADTPVDEVAHVLAEHDISGVPVVGDDGEPVGMISEIDVISRTGDTARDIMSSGVITVTEQTPAEDVVEILRSKRMRRVPVVRGDRIIGIVSRSDLLRLFTVTRWSCTECGYFTRGLMRPERCSQCGSLSIELEREPPGM